MRKIYIFLSLLLFLCGCKKMPVEFTLLEDGTYIGTFQRLYADGTGEIANVTLHLYQGNWSGESDIEH